SACVILDTRARPAVAPRMTAEYSYGAPTFAILRGSSAGAPIQRQESRQGEQSGPADALEPQRARRLEQAHGARAEHGVSQHDEAIERSENHGERQVLRKLGRARHDELRQE